MNGRGGDNVTATDTAAQATKSIAAERKGWLSLAVLLSGAFMALLDTTIVKVAIPTIRTSIGASNAMLSWIISGYALAFGPALIPAGRVGDRVGHKWVFVVGLGVSPSPASRAGSPREPASWWPRVRCRDWPAG
jgi:MFS family permease